MEPHEISLTPKFTPPLDPDFKPSNLERGQEVPYLGILFKKSTDLDQAKRVQEGGRV